MKKRKYKYLFIFVIVLIIARKLLRKMNLSDLWIIPLGTYVVTSKYGMRSSGFHNGVDLAAPSGTSIYAPADATVESKYFHSAGGNSLILKHENGFKTGYAHLSSYATGLSVGDKILKGQIIGYVGSTGHSTGPHLHFTLTDNYGNKQDPMKSNLFQPWI